MANKTNTAITGRGGKEYQYFRIQRKIGVKQNKRGEWVSEYKAFYGRSEKEAKQKYTDFMESRKRSEMADKPLGDLITIYSDSVLKKDSRIKASTAKLYTDAFKTIEALPVCRKPLASVTALDLQQMINNLTCKPSTVHQLVKLLRRFYKYATANGYIGFDPSVSLVLPEIPHKREDQTIETWSDDEIRQIKSGLDAFYKKNSRDHRLRLFMYIALNTGMRSGEILGLKYSDIDLDARSIFIRRQLAHSPDGMQLTGTKTKSSVRSVPLNDELLREIRRHETWHKREAKKRGYPLEMVFTTASGLFVDSQNVRTSLNRFYKAYDIPLRNVHTYRHTFASKLAAAGVPIQTVAALLGHDGINTTSRYYVNIADQQKREALKALDVTDNQQIITFRKRSKVRKIQRKDTPSRDNA